MWCRVLGQTGCLVLCSNSCQLISCNGSSDSSLRNAKLSKVHQPRTFEQKKKKKKKKRDRNPKGLSSRQKSIEIARDESVSAGRSRAFGKKRRIRAGTGFFDQQVIFELIR